MLLRACLVALLAGAQASAAGVAKVTASATELVFQLDAPAAGLSLVELAPYETNARAGTVVVRQLAAAAPVRLPRFDGARDRLYSGFVAARGGEAVGAIRFTEDLNRL